MASEKITAIVEEIKTLTILEVAEKNYKEVEEATKRFHFNWCKTVRFYIKIYH